MRVDEMIARVNQLDSEELARLRSAVERAQAQLEETDEERWKRGDEILNRLRQGIANCGGMHVSANIDEALYGERSEA